MDHISCLLVQGYGESWPHLGREDSWEDCLVWELRGECAVLSDDGLDFLCIFSVYVVRRQTMYFALITHPQHSRPTRHHWQTAKYIVAFGTTGWTCLFSGPACQMVMGSRSHWSMEAWKLIAFQGSIQPKAYPVMNHGAWYWRVFYGPAIFNFFFTTHNEDLWPWYISFQGLIFSFDDCLLQIRGWSLTISWGMQGRLCYINGVATFTFIVLSSSSIWVPSRFVFF